MELEEAVRDALEGCNKFLAYFNDDTMSFDGCHSDVEEVSKAKELMESIGLCRHLSSFKMVTIVVEDVPEYTGDDINWGAVEACRERVTKSRK